METTMNFSAFFACFGKTKSQGITIPLLRLPPTSLSMNESSGISVGPRYHDEQKTVRGVKY